MPHMDPLVIAIYCGVHDVRIYKVMMGVGSFWEGQKLQPSVCPEILYLFVHVVSITQAISMPNYRDIMAARKSRSARMYSSLN